jgi:anti-anti-sigma factor
MPTRHVKTARDRGVLVLTILDEELHSDSTAEALRRELIAEILASDVKKVALDFCNVRFITTIAFQPLLSVRRKVNELSGQMVICGLTAPVLEVFDVTRLISTKPGALAAFDHEPDVAAAVARLQPAS